MYSSDICTACGIFGGDGVYLCCLRTWSHCIRYFISGLLAGTLFYLCIDIKMTVYGTLGGRQILSRAQDVVPSAFLIKSNRQMCKINLIGLPAEIVSVNTFRDWI